MLRLREAGVNFQVSSNNEMHTVNVKQHPLTSNPPQLGNNEWLSLRPPTKSFQQKTQQAVELFVGTTCRSCYISVYITNITVQRAVLDIRRVGKVFCIV